MAGPGRSTVFKGNEKLRMKEDTKKRTKEGLIRFDDNV